MIEAVRPQKMLELISGIADSDLLAKVEHDLEKANLSI